MLYSYVMKNRMILVLAISMMALVGCTIFDGSSLATSSSTQEDSAGVNHSATASSDFSNESSTSQTSSSDHLSGGDQAAFFKGQDSVSISISFTNAALYDLSRYGGETELYEHKYDDVYFPAEFRATINEQTYLYEDVGVRMKGATSRRTIADSQGNITDSAHLKVNFQCTFDDDLYDLGLFSSYKHVWAAADREKRKDREFFGLEKLDLKYLPRNTEAINGMTYSQEIYTYEMFNRYEVPAPYARWVNVSLSSQKQTKNYQFEAVEPIDKKFLKYHLGESKGDLYKCVQVLIPNTSGGGWYPPGSFNGEVKYADMALSGAVATSFDANRYANGLRTANGMIGVEDNFNDYHPNYCLKTNDSEGENSDFTKMADFLNVAYSLRYRSAPYSMLDEMLDVDEFLRFSAISFLMGNYDDMRNNFNNYYIYFRLSDGKAVFIPYDYDYSLGLVKDNEIYNWISTARLFTTTSSHNVTNTNNLFYDTILTNQNLSYQETGARTQADLQAYYGSTAQQAISEGALTYSNYLSFIQALPDSRTDSTKEKALVQNYMNAKRAVVPQPQISEATL